MPSPLRRKKKMRLPHVREEEKNASAHSRCLTVVVRHDKTNHGLFLSQVQPPQHSTYNEVIVNSRTKNIN